MQATVSNVFWDVWTDRLLPLLIARASHSLLHPLDWGAPEVLVFGVLTQVGLEFYRHGVPQLFGSWDQLPPRGKPLETLQRIDRLYIACSQVAIVVMTFHFLQFMAASERVLWQPAQLSAASVLLPLPALFLVYDAFYSVFHRALHHRSVYAYVHKHHHRQLVPTRGNTDAINVHPLEFIPGEHDRQHVHDTSTTRPQFVRDLSSTRPRLAGEYNHLLAFYLVSRAMPVHALSGILFLVLGGTLATLNHTRIDFSALRLPFTQVPIFGVRAHDTHHAIPNSNYGQYIMLLDFLMGTYRLHPQDPGSVEERRREAEGPSGAARGDAADGNARPTRALGAGRAKQM